MIRAGPRFTLDFGAVDVDQAGNATSKAVGFSMTATIKSLMRTAFINEANAWKGKAITSAAATLLVTDAKAAIASLR